MSGPIPIPCSLNSNNSVRLDLQIDGTVSSGTTSGGIKYYLFYGGFALPSSGYWFPLSAGYLSLIFADGELMLAERDAKEYTRFFGTESYTGRHQVYFHPSGGLLDSTVMHSASSEGFWLGLGYMPPIPSSDGTSFGMSGAAFASVGTFYGVSVTSDDEYVFYGIPCSNAEGVEGIYDVVEGAFHATRQVCTITRVSTAFTDPETGNRVYRYRATYPPLVNVTIAGSVVYPAGVTEALISKVPGSTKLLITSPAFDDRYVFVYGGYVRED